MYSRAHCTGSTTAMVSGITQTGQNLAYTYDDGGNTTSEVRGCYAMSYEYDHLEQPTRVNDEHANET